MKKARIEIPKVMAAFKKVYRGRKNLSFRQQFDGTLSEDLWVDQVMGRIRSEAPPPSPVGLSVIFEQMFWRFAPAAVLVVCLLSIWFFQVGATVEYDVASLVMTDPIGFGELSSLGL